jgi:chaperonin GroES
MTELKPRNDYILVLPDEAAKMKGSLYVPQGYARPQTRGTVMAVGPGYLLADGTRSEMDLKPDDRVEFHMVPGQPIVDLDGEPHLVLKETEVLGILTGEPEAEMIDPDEDEDEDTDEGAPQLAVG